MSHTADTAPADLLEEGDPADDPRAFRRALSQFATGVTVITTIADGQPVGMAANSFSAVSLDPPLVLWSIRKESRSLQSFLGSGVFAVNVLAEDQMEASSLFGRPQPDQFGQADWFSGRLGAPLLNGTIAQFECTTVEVLDGGDHHILLGKVERFARFGGGPLLFAQGQYGVAESHPALAVTAPPAESVDDEGQESSLFMSLLQGADHHMSALFQEYRHQVGVTLPTGRVLNRLSRGPCTPQVLERDTFLGENAVEDALAELAGKGHAVRREDGTWALTEDGREVRGALRRSAEHFSARQLRGVSDDDLAAAERVLVALLGRGRPDGPTP